MGNLPPFTPTSEPEEVDEPEDDAVMSPPKRQRPNWHKPPSPLPADAMSPPPARAQHAQSSAARNNFAPNFPQPQDQQQQQQLYQLQPMAMRDGQRVVGQQSPRMMALMQASAPPVSHPLPSMPMHPMMGQLTPNQGHLQSAPSFSGGSLPPTNYNPAGVWVPAGGMSPSLWQPQPVRALPLFLPSWHLRGIF